MKEKEIKEEEERKFSDEFLWCLIFIELFKPDKKSFEIEMLENRMSFLEGKISTIENIIK